MRNRLSGRPISRPERYRPLSDFYQLIELPRVPDHRGCLTFLEAGRHIPFAIARVYYIYDVPESANRAGHAHHRLRELVIAAAGGFTVHLDNGFVTESMRLDRPDRGLLLPPLVWRTLDRFSPGALCLVLGSDPYDEADYVRDYEAFARLCRSGG